MKLKHLFQLAFISIFLFAGSVTASADNFDNSSIINYNDLAYSYYYPNGTYSGYGTITGAGQVYMVLTVQGESVSGKYYYVKTNKNRKNKAWIYLSGFYAEVDDQCVVTEHANGSKNGGFYGELFSLNNSSTRFCYEGKFHRNDGRSFNFRINLK